MFWVLTTGVRVLRFRFWGFVLGKILRPDRAARKPAGSFLESSVQVFKSPSKKAILSGYWCSQRI
jgi:hypothetical protein